MALLGEFQFKMYFFSGTFRVDQGLRLHALSTGARIQSLGTRSHMLQLRPGAVKLNNLINFKKFAKSQKATVSLQ